MTQKELISNLNKFFSNVSFDFYNIQMAILLSFYKNKFNPMTLKELQNTISSRKDFKEKLRKSSGQNYAVIELAIKNALNNRKKMFKKFFDEEKNETKYSILLDRVKRLWESNSSSMEKLKLELNKSQSKVSKHKNILEYDSDANNLKNKLNNKLLLKKRKRKNFASDDEESKEESFKNYSIYRPKGYKSNLKINNKKENQSKSSSNKTSGIVDNENDEYYCEEENNRSKSADKFKKANKDEFLFDEFNRNYFNSLNNKGKVNNDSNLKNVLFKNNIYDKIPNKDEDAINILIDKFSKLGQKIKEIQSDLKGLLLSKSIQKCFNDNNKKEEKQKELINNYYEEINSLLENSDYNFDNFKGKNENLKKCMGSFLDIYENSYENLLRILSERNHIFDNVFYKKEEHIKKELEDCFSSLNKYINTDKRQINDTFRFLSIYTRNFYLKSFGNLINKIDIRHKENMKKIEEEKKKKEKVEKALLNQTIKNNAKFFNFENDNNGEKNKKDEINIEGLDNNNSNINKNIILNNNVITPKIIDFTEYSIDAPPAGNVNIHNINNNPKVIAETIYNNKNKINEIVKDQYIDIMNNENNNNNEDISDNLNSGNETTNNNNENDIFGDNEKFDGDSNNEPYTPSFPHEYSVGNENNV